MNENKIKDLIKIYEGENGTISINKNNIEEHNKITDLIKNKKKAKKDSNIKYYIKNAEKIRLYNLKYYHDKKTTTRKIGRPRKYND